MATRDERIKKNLYDLLIGDFLKTTDCFNVISNRRREGLIQRMDDFVSGLEDFYFDGEKAREVRLSLGLSQRELGRQIKVSPAYIGQLERESRVPRHSRKAVKMKVYGAFLRKHGYDFRKMPSSPYSPQSHSRQ